MKMEYKISFFRPAAGDCLECRGHVIKAGRQILFTQADIVAVKGKERTLVATARRPVP
jgi:acyl-coenzyme A thioesterase PaaI-like protein